MSGSRGGIEGGSVSFVRGEVREEEGRTELDAVGVAEV